MDRLVFEKFEGAHITDDMIQAASNFFSEHYGVWSLEAEKLLGPFAKRGRHVRMSSGYLKAQCASDSTGSLYVRVLVDGTLAGHAFACAWEIQAKRICWITQLVVHEDYRRRGLATGMLSHFRSHGDVFGVLSSHPAACMAVYTAFGLPKMDIQLDFIQKHAEAIMQSSPVKYVREAKVHGALFDHATDGTISCADTQFFVDHTEPLESLAIVRERMAWPLGELLEGHEFLLLIARKGD